MEATDARDDLPRVSIESLQDWKRIRRNIQTAALATLDKKLNAHGLSKPRDAYVEHIMQFIDRTFEIAKPNLRVNGLNFEDYNDGEEEADAYDEALDRHVWSLSDARRKWDVEIAQKRRTFPQETEQLLRDLIARQRESDDLAMGEEIEEIEEMGVEIDEALSTGDAPEPMLSLLAELDGDIPQQIQRSERVKQVETEIRMLKP